MRALQAPLLIAASALLASAWIGQAVGRAPEAMPNATSVASRGARARIASASLPTDEIALALVAPRELSALSVFADDVAVSHVVAVAKRVPARVGPSVEALAALEPTVVIADPFGQIGAERFLNPLGVRVVRTQVARTVDDVAQNIRVVGDALGQSRQASKLALGLLERVARVQQRVHGAARPRVLVYGRGFTAGTDTLTDDLLTRAGARNAALDAHIVGHSDISLEQVFALDPDYLVLSEYRADGRARTVRALPSDMSHPIWSHLRAVKQGHVVYVPQRDLLSTSQHVAEAVQALARAIHPEAFESAP